MDLDKFINLALQLHSSADSVAVTRHYSAWKKSCPNGTSDDAKAYLAMHCPNENAVSLWDLLQAYGDATPHAVSMAEKWIKQQKLFMDQTICGPYLSAKTTTSLKDFLEMAVPVRFEFDKFCYKNSLDNTPALFANFVSFAKKDITKTNYHPFCSEKEYWLGSVTSLYELFQGWSASYTMSQPSPLPDYLSIAEAAEMLGITAKQLFAWLQQHATFCVLHKGQWLLSASMVDQLHTDWNSTTPIVSLLPTLLDTLRPDLIEEWDYEQNDTLTPTMVTAHSGKQAWWKCKKCGQQWPAKISDRVAGHGCPYCAGQRPIIGETDLATLHPDLADEWDFEKNGDLTPTMVTAHSGKKVWWRCNICGRSWKTSVNSRSRGSGCRHNIRNRKS